MKNLSYPDRSRDERRKRYHGLSAIPEASGRSMMLMRLQHQWHGGKTGILFSGSITREELSCPIVSLMPVISVLQRLEKYFNVHIITQNIDNLHERAGSTKVLHLHGELTKARSTADPSLIYEIGYKEIKPGDVCEKGSQLRPHIVWFGEAVPMMDEAVRITSTADIFVVIGSSLNVYPAAGLIEYTPKVASHWLIDPNDVSVPSGWNINVIKEPASAGVAILTTRLLQLQ